MTIDLQQALREWLERLRKQSDELRWRAEMTEDDALRASLLDYADRIDIQSEGVEDRMQ